MTMIVFVKRDGLEKTVIMILMTAWTSPVRMGVTAMIFSMTTRQDFKIDGKKFLFSLVINGAILIEQFHAVSMSTSVQRKEL